MADAKATISIPDNRSIDFDGKYTRVYGTATINADPATYPTGGIVMSFADSQIKSQRAPRSVRVTGRNASALFVYVAGTDNTNGKLKIFTAVNTEVGNGTAISSQVSGDTLDFEAVWLGQGT